MFDIETLTVILVVIVAVALTTRKLVGLFWTARNDCTCDSTCPFAPPGRCENMLEDNDPEKGGITG